MIFLDTFLCGDIMSMPLSPTDISDITKVEVAYAEYDDLYITQDAESELTSEIPEKWDFDTILHAMFDGTTSAGNVGWSLDAVSNLLIKRKHADDLSWQTINVATVNSVEDLNIKGTDITAGIGLYNYAAVPVFYGIEGEYSIIPVECSTRMLVVADENEIWATPLTDGFCNTNTVFPLSVISTLNNKYPTIVRNSSANYEEISVSARFYKFNKETCSFEIENDSIRNKYIEDCKVFLTNGKAKMLKNVDGRRWLVYVTTPPSDNAENDYRLRLITFGCTEVGNADSEEDLYRVGITNVGEEWWST